MSRDLADDLERMRRAYDVACTSWNSEIEAHSRTKGALASAIGDSNKTYLRGCAEALEEADCALCRLMLQVYGSEDRTAQRVALSDAIQVIRQMRNCVVAERSLPRANTPAVSPYEADDAPAAMAEKASDL